MTTAYPLFQVSILIIVFYALSSVLVHTGLVNKANHRRFWNVMLLIAFLITALTGLLSVVKINYKLEIPIYNELLGYHVDFGIGMAVVGLIHFWWHLTYYLHLFKGGKREESVSKIVPVNDLDATFLMISAFLLGSTSIIAQIILLREFLSVFSANELVVGLVLTNWMVLTGIGASLGRFPLMIRKASGVVVPGLLILSVLPFVTTFFINFLKNIIFPIGAMISIFQLFFVSLLLLIPFCLLSGLLFTFISRCYSEISNQNETGPVYGFESAGSIAGGLLSGMLFIFIFSSVESLLVLPVINGLLLVILFLKKKGYKFAGLSLVVVLPSFVLLFFHPEEWIRGLVYPNQKIVVSKDSPQGNIVITSRENLWTVYNNNVLLFDSENFMFSEEAVHFAMVQHPHPSNVLLVSGGISGQIAELRKYGPISIDYVEDNQWLMALMKDSAEKIMTPQISLYITDPLRFIRGATKKYDIVLLNLPAPSTLQTNRFYTIEFYTLLKKKLSPEAVLSFGLPAPANYLNKESVELNSTIYTTLKKVFQNVIIIPGEKIYYLASDAILTFGIASAVQEKKIENRYVNIYYFNDLLLKSRGETILSSLNPAADINLNLKPVLYRQQLDFWLSYFTGKYWLMAVLAGALAMIVFYKGGAHSKAVFLAGFSASGMEILLLFGLQVFFGNIYLLVSFIFTSFMLGLAIGSLNGKSFITTQGKGFLSLIQLLTGALTAVIGLTLFIPAMSGLAPVIVYMLYLAASVIIGGLTGFQFTQASLGRPGSYSEISGKNYSYDLFGSALGALAITLYMIPKLGIVLSVFTISFLNFISGICVYLMKNRGG
jgi:spermidine synthase